MEFMDLIETPRVNQIKYGRQVFNEELGQMSLKFSEGSLCLTSHHLLLTSSDRSQEIWIMHSIIDSIENNNNANNNTKENKDSANKFQLIIKCKDFQVFIIEFSVLNQCMSVFKSLDALSNITSESMKLPFFHNMSNLIKSADNDGWSIYSIEKEFQMYFESSTEPEWRITQVNNNYSVCATYPTKLIVPKSADDNTLIKSSQFRSMARFPVLSYYHKATKSFIVRCSQPLLGSNNKRCKEDEYLLKSLLPIGKQGYIYDLRDLNLMKSAAKSNQGGYETEQCYPLWKRINRHLDRFDQLYISFIKLVETCRSESTSSWLTRLDSSGWYLNARQAMHISSCIADEIHNKNACVIVHGSDGLDNTLLITSLVKLMLNDEYRTMNGIQMLIEGEWLSAGHPFAKRCAKSAFAQPTGSASGSVGPTFVLFLDCVRLLLDQFCVSFEFNQEFLVFLFDNVYASQYGTFLANCARERNDLFVKERTVSLWSFVNLEENLKVFLNPIYEKNTGALWPSLYYHSLSIWSKLFLRYQRNEAPFIEQKNEITKIQQEYLQAKLRVDKLRSEFLQLQNEAITKGVLEKS